MTRAGIGILGGSILFANALYVVIGGAEVFWAQTLFAGLGLAVGAVLLHGAAADKVAGRRAGLYMALAGATLLLGGAISALTSHYPILEMGIYNVYLLLALGPIGIAPGCALLFVGAMALSSDRLGGACTMIPGAAFLTFLVHDAAGSAAYHMGAAAGAAMLVLGLLLARREAPRPPKNRSQPELS